MATVKRLHRIGPIYDRDSWPPDSTGQNPHSKICTRVFLPAFGSPPLVGNHACSHNPWGSALLQFTHNGELLAIMIEMSNAKIRRVARER